MSKKGTRGLTDDDLKIWLEATKGFRIDKKKKSYSTVTMLKKSYISDYTPRLYEIKSFKIKEMTPLSTQSPSMLSFKSSANHPHNMDRKKYLQLRRGKMKIDRTIDLHGYTQAQAQERLISFVHNAHAQQARLVLVITGKGHHKHVDEFMRPVSGVLKNNVPNWLAPITIVHNILPAHPKHGGDGAFYVYLKKK